MASDSDRIVRRLRKKLRQIENLEILRRDLNEEELAKVDKKNEIRLELSNLLRDLPSHNSPEEVDGFTLLNASDVPSDEMKRKSTEPSENLNENKKPCPPQGTSGSTEEGSSVVVVTEAAGPSSGSSETEQTQTRVETPEPAGDSAPQRPPERPRSSVTRERERQRRKQSLLSSWRASLWRVRELEGHEDLVLDCDLGPGLAVTASRDTTVKVWGLASSDGGEGEGQLLFSLRGHTGPVTGVRLLHQEDSRRLGEALG